MPPEADLLFVLLALQMNLLSRDKLLEAAAAWMAAPGGTFAALLESRGFLGPDKAAAVRALVEARFRETLVPPRPPSTAVRTLPVAAPGRYELKAELGRGGLGRVVEAWDEALRRQVAVKLLHAQPAGDAPDRFAREARLAARLEHPAIIPVYDFGALPATDGRAQVFLAMKRVVGRDLDRVLRELEEGRAETRRTWSRARLLRVFQDVCLGMAFAHDRGIVHRDLKPSNIMIGDYGETLIVDWGLAKDIKAAAEAAKAGDQEPVVGDPDTTVRMRSKTSSQVRSDSEAIALSHSPMLTFAGDILGTPAYMSPEQAEGRVDDIDARSDIFALGAILYEILALRPPFEGRSVEEVMARVRDGAVTPPSKARVQRAADPSPPSSTTQAGDAVPPELDAICLRALARRPADRYQTARDFHDDIQLFLEGVQERDRRRAAAEAAVAQVREALTRRRRLRDEAGVAGEEAKRLEAATAPLADKAALWAAEDRAQGLRRQAAAAHADAVSALTRALEHDREHKDARALMADLAWESFVEAEEAGDEAAALIHRRVAEEFHDGRLEAQLRGEGTLEVRTVAFPCECLSKGRTVFPEELASGAWHPFSGRALAGTPGAEGLPALEPASVVRLRVHGTLCAPADLAGADVWLFRHEDIGRRLVPVTPHGLRGPDVPAPVLDALFAKDSPGRPQGPGFHLGRTPIPRRTLPMGSYLLVLAKDGRAPARVPVCVSRGGHVEQPVTLFRPGEVPEGFSAVAEGAFGYQGDRDNPYSGPAETRDVPTFFLATHPVTCREYAAFLNALPPAEAARRAPRASSDAPPLWPGPTWTWVGARPVPNTDAAWEPEWPVVGVSWEDAMAYAAWKRSQDGRLVTLPTSVQWEKAARGPDRRIYPWGAHLDPRWANGERSHDGPPRPAEVGAFPADESPYGVRGLAGNTRDACLDDAGSDWPGRRWFRGGTWARPAIEMRASDRTALGTKVVVYDFGFRIAIAARLEPRGRS
ncbi:MAG: SUMF1/EgtB/PvdO family nonheme iron enzyme [Planctomycetia bacterium]|nr:SUMF1/EgtB/PvdO family nonheme iron enzyme [Planctomycetia bacterium]